MQENHHWKQLVVIIVVFVGGVVVHVVSGELHAVAENLETAVAPIAAPMGEN